mmetsp:Transcript_7812/g.21776  ORF Transcript_7812/g.21776 Transcript_7812/m.21776 type:complete len:87 (-) Transcript_7812:105-365(-)
MSAAMDLPSIFLETWGAGSDIFFKTVGEVCLCCCNRWNEDLGDGTNAETTKDDEGEWTVVVDAATAIGNNQKIALPNRKQRRKQSG